MDPELELELEVPESIVFQGSRGLKKLFARAGANFRILRETEP